MMSQDTINLITACSGAIVGWVLKVIWDAVRTLQEDMKEIERDLHTSYVSKDDYRNDIAEIKDILKQIFDKLDKKADK
jgi:hypothetical protein